MTKSYTNYTKGQFATRVTRELQKGQYDKSDKRVTQRDSTTRVTKSYTNYTKGQFATRVTRELQKGQYDKSDREVTEYFFTYRTVCRFSKFENILFTQWCIFILIFV